GGGGVGQGGGTGARRWGMAPGGGGDIGGRGPGRGIWEPLPGQFPIRRSDRAARRPARADQTTMMRFGNRNQVTVMGTTRLRFSTSCAALCALALLASLHAQQQAPPQPPPPPQTSAPVRPGADDQGFRFKSGVELINVTATVSDGSGRFVSGLRQDDFTVYEDDTPVTVTHFSADRVPVSLGIALDTSGSMAGSKIQAAQDALDRFLYELLDKEDEIFLYRFSNVPMLLQGWTRDRQLISRALGRITPNGGTALYDAVADALPLAQQGQHRKKALL